MSTIHTKPLTSSPTSSTLSSKISSRDPSALNATPVIKEKNALSAQSISPKAKINPRELFSRLINLSSAKSILQHIESLTSQLAASKNLQVFEDLLQDGQYSKSFQHALHKGLPHPASPVGRENLKECLASLNKINEQGTTHIQRLFTDHELI